MEFTIFESVRLEALKFLYWYYSEKPTLSVAVFLEFVSSQYFLSDVEHNITILCFNSSRSSNQWNSTYKRYNEEFTINVILLL